MGLFAIWRCLLLREYHGSSILSNRIHTSRSRVAARSQRIIYCFLCAVVLASPVWQPSKPSTSLLCTTGSLTLPSLRCSLNVPQEFRDSIRFELGLFNCNCLRSLAKWFLGNVGSVVHQQMPCCTRHWWDEDVAAFEAELNVLKYPVGSSDGGIAGVRVNVLAFLARKKEEVKAIREVSPTSVDVKASLIIVYSSMHSSVQNGIKIALHLVAPNHLMSASTASKSRRYIPPMARWGRGSRGVLSVLRLGSSSSATQRVM
jgi:hypothetical protein